MPTPYQRNTEDDYAPSQQGKKFIHERPGIPPGISGIGPKDMPTAHDMYELADRLTSGTGPVVDINRSADGRLHIQAASANAFEVELQWRPEQEDAYSTLGTYDETGLNDENALQADVEIKPGDYRLVYNSGSAAVSAKIRS